MTLQMAIGRMIVEKIVGHPEKFPPEVCQEARCVIANLPAWREKSGLFTPENWNKESASWRDFCKAIEKHGIDLPAILQEDAQ
jgi:hypothetical protein